jgi:signal transduction histidine kinase
MKPVSDLLHRTPWLVLLGGGFVAIFALALFVTPFHIIDLKHDEADPVQRRAITREIDNAFADNALDIARGVLRGMRRSTNDPQRQAELDQALESIDEARTELREAGVEVLRAKREAAQDARDALKNATDAIKQAQKDAEEALAESGADREAVRKALEDSLAAAKKAQEEARIAADEAADKARADLDHRARIVNDHGKRRIIVGGDNGKPRLDIELDGDAPTPPPPPAAGAGAVPPPGAGAGPVPPIPPVPAIVLPPERRAEIHRGVTRDLYRIATGAGILLLFIPLFVVAVVSKIFVDRSRAALRMAELKRKEAEYHRMSQQVTEAKLSALQAQVEPHFLYNTLASVQALTEVDPPQASAMTGHLIQYLRNALPKMRESVSTVGQEVELVRAYLNILQMRMGKRLAFTIDVPESLQEAPFPPLMLPSLVENAIKHGLEPQREGGEVAIRAEEADGRIRMIVADTGRGFSEAPGAGVGLANIRERLAALYGAEGKLTLEANTPRGVVATIEVPRRASAPAAAPAEMPMADEAPPAPRTRAQKTLRVLGTIERGWRKGLWWLFLGLAGIAAVFAVVGVVAALTGHLPVQIEGNELPFGKRGAIMGSLGIIVAFLAVLLALAIVTVVVYALGFLMIGVVVFALAMVLIGLSPILAPLVLLGLGIWWLARRANREAAAERERKEPTMAASAAAAPEVRPGPTPPPAAP